MQHRWWVKWTYVNLFIVCVICNEKRRHWPKNWQNGHNRLSLGNWQHGLETLLCFWQAKESNQ
jgi:hypothetical protein